MQCCSSRRVRPADRFSQVTPKTVRGADTTNADMNDKFGARRNRSARRTPRMRDFDMTEQQAIDHLHSRLPREALFTVTQRRMIESRIDRQSLRSEPLHCDMSSEWIVSVSQFPYVHSTCNAELDVAVNGALTHF